MIKRFQNPGEKPKRGVFAAAAPKEKEPPHKAPDRVYLEPELFSANRAAPRPRAVPPATPIRPKLRAPVEHQGDELENEEHTTPAPPVEQIEPAPPVEQIEPAPPVEQPAETTHEDEESHQ
jgi:hypothetical protein